MPADISLYLVTDRRRTRNRPLADCVQAALDGGIRTVQLREKDLTGRELLRLATDLRERTRRSGARLLINDRIDVALAVDADGVHLGQDAIGAKEARRLVGPNRKIGVSTHSIAEAVSAEREGADFVVFGPVYWTPSKAAFGPPQGTDALSAVVAAIRIPVLAIGGIVPERVSEVRRSGAAGVAVVSAILEAASPESAARSLVEAWSRRESADSV